MFIAIVAAVKTSEVHIFERNNPGIIFNQDRNVDFIKQDRKIITSVNARVVFATTELYTEIIKNITDTNTMRRLADAALYEQVYTLNRRSNELTQVKKIYDGLVAAYTPWVEIPQGEQISHLHTNTATEIIRDIEQFRQEGKEYRIINKTLRIIMDNAIDQMRRQYSTDLLLLINNLTMLHHEVGITDRKNSQIGTVLNETIRLIDLNLNLASEIIKFMETNRVTLPTRLLGKAIKIAEQQAQGRAPLKKEELSAAKIAEVTKTEIMIVSKVDVTIYCRNRESKVASIYAFHFHLSIFHCGFSTLDSRFRQ